MDRNLIQIGQFIRRTEAGSPHFRENWIGVITDMDIAKGLVTVLWLYKTGFKNNTQYSIDTVVQQANDLDDNGATDYSIRFITSKSIDDYPLIISLTNLAGLQRFTNSTRQRIRAHLGQPPQQSLPLNESKNEEKNPDPSPSDESPKLFMVIDSESLKPMSRANADKLLRQASLNNPGKTYTLVQMLEHAKYPTEPLIVKA